MPGESTAPVAVECIIPILSVKDLAASVRYYVDVLGFSLDWGDDDQSPVARFQELPTRYPWAYEMRVQDPDGHVLRFGSEPRPDA
jgi:catechol 2,3-dioxygenase-like lactoylglutathione lyase family enzyme